jgi:hypothetical protein
VDIGDVLRNIASEMATVWLKSVDVDHVLIGRDAEEVNGPKRAQLGTYLNNGEKS